MLKLKSTTELEKEAKTLKESENYIGLVRIIEEQISRETNKEKKKLLKLDLKDAIKKTQKNMKNFSQEISFKKEQIDNIVNYFTQDKEINEILKTIGFSHLLFPNPINVKKTANETMPVMLNLVSTQLYNEKGDILKYGSIADTYWYFNIYGINYNIIANIYLQNIFASILKNKSFTLESLETYLDELLTFTGNKIIVNKGLERFFAKDYISSLHILVPQFENIFMILSEELGVDITKIGNPNKKKGETSISTGTKTLGLDKLDSEEFQTAWGDDICELIKYILYHDLGLKLRHNIAHGEIESHECNYSHNLIIIYLFILLATRINIGKQ